MKKLTITLLITIFFVANITAQESFNCGDTFTDPRDGQTYNTVYIGNQCWMAENLNIGTMVNGIEQMTNNAIFEKYCYDNNTSNCDIYGGLYQWDEMMQYLISPGVQGICPSGWHLPTDAEWCILEQEVDATITCSSTGWRGVDGGGKLKEAGTSHWSSPNTGATNSSGFTGLPGGNRNNGNFEDISFNGNFWTSNEFITAKSWMRGLEHTSAEVQRSKDWKSNGYSVRCLMDEIILGANFEAEPTLVAVSSQVQFIDLSIGNRTAWQWDFENDGTIDSELQNPTWTYNEPGIYTVSLTVSNETKETSTEIKEDYIWVVDTVVIIIDPVSQSLCEGENLFLSVEATGDSLHYQWQKNEINIPEAINSTYSIDNVLITDSGNYRCIVYNLFSSETSDNAIITVNPLPVIDLGDDTSICQGESITFDPGSGYSSYLWQDGSTSQIFTTDTAGIFWVEVSTVFACTTIDSISLSIDQIPLADFDYSQNCNDKTINFTDLSIANNGEIINWFWDFGDNFSSEDTSILQNPSYSYSSTDIYDVQLSVVNSSGCFDDTLKSIEIIDPFTVNLGNDSLVCCNSNISLTALAGNGIPPYSYLWSTGSTDSVLSALIISDTVFYIEVYDNNECFISDTINIFIRPVFEGEEICLVTVDSITNKNMVIWEKTPDVCIEYYNIYKEFATNVYEVIGTVPYDSLSVFVDMESEPLVHSDKYKISAVDLCGNESELSSYHKTIILQANMGIGQINLEWINYEGFYVGYNYIYKGSTNNLTLYDSVPGSQEMYNDLYLNPFKLQYAIVNDKGDTCYASEGKAAGDPYSQSLSNLRDLTIFGFLVDVKVMLEGPFNGTDMNAGLNNDLPLNQPYNIPPWNYMETESVENIPSPDVVDWVLVELRETAGDASTATSDKTIATRAGFLLKDGTIVDLDGMEPMHFVSDVVDNLYVVVWHRNHLNVISSTRLIESNEVYSYDFTIGAEQAYGGADGHKELSSGIWGMIGGDGNANGQIDSPDKETVWALNAGNSGFLSGDFTMELQLDNKDKNDIWEVNNGLSTQTPDNKNNNSQLTWRFANPLTIQGSPKVFQFDVELKCDDPGTYHTQTQIYFEYNTLAFGENIDGFEQNPDINERISCSFLELMDTTKYRITNDANNTPGRYAILTKPINENYPIPLSNLTEVSDFYKGFLRFQIEIQDTTQLAGIFFSEWLMNGGQYNLDIDSDILPEKYFNPSVYSNDLINIGFGPTELIADFTADKTEVLVEEYIQFTDLSFGDPISWEWDFDYNGTIDSYEQNPLWAYSEPGTYTVSLTVSDGVNQATETKTEYINVIAEEVVAAFDVSGNHGCSPFEVIFTNQSVGTIISYLWDFGDGETSIEENPAHTFSGSDNYTVILTVIGYLNNDIAEETIIVELAEPLITSIQDRPNDQGGYVYLSFIKSFYDNVVPGGTKSTEGYSFQRLDNEVWVSLSSIYATGDENYIVQLSTLFDSTANSTGLTSFRVIAGMDEGTWFSEPAEGYSVDNIAPSAPQDLDGFVVENHIELVWQPSPDEDFQYFAIYKSEESGNFQAEPFATTIETIFIDNDLSSETIYYVVSAFDYSGNESEYSNELEISLFMSQEIELFYGYQFISSHIIPENPNILNICNNILPNLDFVRNSSGLMLRKIGPMWINSIGDWVTTEGYIFRMNNADNLSIGGEIIDPETPIQLTSGYQFISYLLVEPVNALIAFQDILDNLDFVRNSDGSMLRKIGPIWINGIGDLIPGEGYLVRMNDADVLIYPVTDKKYTGVSNKQTEYFNFEGGNAADPIYSIYFEGLEIGDEVATYDGDVKVGAMKINSENTFDNDLPVFSTLNSGAGYKAGKPITIKVWDASTQKLIPFEYTMIDPYNDAYMKQVYPTEDGLYSIININKGVNIENERGDISIFPNPSEGIFNIMFKGIDGDMQIKVMDIQGNDYRNFEFSSLTGFTTKQLDLKELPAGVYFISFSGEDISWIKKIVIQ